jgi:hypothetical protein
MVCRGRGAMVIGFPQMHAPAKLRDRRRPIRHGNQIFTFFGTLPGALKRSSRLLKRDWTSTVRSTVIAGWRIMICSPVFPIAR